MVTYNVIVFGDCRMPKQGEPEASTVTMDEICDTFDTLF